MFMFDFICMFTELTSLLAMKTAAREAAGLAADPVFRSWDFRFYTHAQMEALHQVSMDEVKEYFPLQAVLTKMFGVYERIFGLQVRRCPYDSMLGAYVLTMSSLTKLTC